MGRKVKFEKLRIFVVPKSLGILVKEIVFYSRSSRVEFLVGTLLSLNLSNKVRVENKKQAHFFIDVSKIR